VTAGKGCYGPQYSDAGGTTLGTQDERGFGPQLQPGARVQVLNRFSGDWTGIFEVERETGDGYELRRVSDGCVLPNTFSPSEVRPRVRP
jgi:hypothetical protein